MFFFNILQNQSHKVTLGPGDMMRPDQEAIDTFMSITGVSETIAVQKLEEHRGNLNEAVNAYFNEGDRNQLQEASFASAPHDMMDIDDPIPFESHRPSPPLLPFTRDLNPFSLLDSNVENLFGAGSRAQRTPFISYPREVREIPIEVKDSVGASGHSGGAPVIEDVTDSVHEHGQDIHGAFIIDGEDDDRNITSVAVHATDRPTNLDPSAPAIVDVPDFGNDIEEEMIRAAIEASKQEVAMSNQQRGSLLIVEDPPAQTGLPEPEDVVLAQAVSLSLQTAEQEKALRELQGNVTGASEVPQATATADDLGKSPVDGRQSRLEAGSTSFHDEAEDVDELPLIRRRRRRVSSGHAGAPINIEEVDVSSPSSPRQQDNGPPLRRHASDFPNDKWGGISSEEHDAAVMLEAAMFGAIPEDGGYHFPYAPQQVMPDDSGPLIGPYRTHVPRPPSPSLIAQRLIREQQDDEYLASLQADREKELKAKAQAYAALEEQRRKEDEVCRKLHEEQENERQLTAKEASLPQEPAPDDENAVTLLVRMPDGSRRGRRFLKSDNLQCLFNFIDVARVVKPGSYRLVRPYPRRAFGDGDNPSSLHELGLTSKQEALYLELI